MLPPLSEEIAAAATLLLGKLDVDVRTGVRVTAIDADGVHTGSGAVLKADLVVWAAGIQAPAWLADLDGLEVNRAHQLVVATTLATTRDPDIFALGDCAACPWPESGREGAILPPRAQVARQQASLLVKSVKARLAGKPLPTFHFTDFGSLVSLGELSAVGKLMGRLIGGSLLVQGLIARWMYVSLYKMHQIAIHGYLRVVLDTVSRFVRHGSSRASSCIERARRAWAAGSGDAHPGDPSPRRTRRYGMKPFTPNCHSRNASVSASSSLRCFLVEP